MNQWANLTETCIKKHKKGYNSVFQTFTDLEFSKVVADTPPQHTGQVFIEHDFCIKLTI